MNLQARIPLNCSPEQSARLQALQKEFAAACNAIAPIARETRCWNRVALHHMTYRTLREKFPQLGSQMVCNAIYSVSRACRAIYQGQGSPFNLAHLDGRPLPLIRFAPTAPVYFDRHTLSIKAGRLSMFTLDGRLHFDLALSADAERRFREDKVQEIVLSSRGDAFALLFVFGAGNPAGEGAAISIDAADRSGQVGAIPEFLQVVPEPRPQPAGAST